MLAAVAAQHYYFSSDGKKMASDSVAVSSAGVALAPESGPAAGDPVAAVSAAQKRPMNAFLIFCKRHRSVVKSKYPHLENRSITKILGEWWAALDADQKQTYTELARQYKEAFMKANPNFKWYKTDTFPNQQQRAPSMQPPSPPQPRSDSPPTAAGGTAAAAASASSSSSPPAPPPPAPLSSHGSGDQPPHLSQPLSGAKESSGMMTATPSPVANSTPKPPKKRYLENSEFRAQNIAPTSATVAAAAAAVAVTVNHSTNHLPVNTTSSKDKSSSLPAAPTQHPSHNSNHPNNQNHHPNSGSSSHSSHPLPVPVLDVETMNRVIVDALSSNGPNPSPSTYTNGMFDTKSGQRSESSSSGGDTGNHIRGRSSPPDPASDGSHVSVLNGAGAIKSESVASLTAESLLNAESQLPIGSATKAIASAKSAAGAIAVSTAAVSGIVSVTTSISAPPPTPPEDKPLNLSSSKVLHASNQQIIDHFIDKLLSSGGECGEGNPMPAEMLGTSCVNSSNPSATMTTATGSSAGGKGSSGGSSSGGGNNSHRKDRSCKGKRYLEMISESKGSGSKRPKSNSMSSGGSNGDNAESSPSKSSTGNSSKWVSGGFDLEERIAALPQLQDTHLVNALNNNRARSSTMNGKTLVPEGRKNGPDPGGEEQANSPHQHHANPNSPPAPSSPSHHPLMNGDAKSASSHQARVSVDKKAGGEESSSVSSPSSSVSTVCSGDEGDGDSRSSPTPQQKPRSNTNAMIQAHNNNNESAASFVANKLRGSGAGGMQPEAEAGVAAAAAGDRESVSAAVRPAGGPVVTREFLASSFSLNRPQGMDVGPCDGLAALAEVALSQAQAITTSSSS